MQTIPLETVTDATRPAIRVGDLVIDEGTIAAEMQFHPASDRATAAKAAARALVVQALLHQRASMLGLADASLPEPDEAAVAALLERELEIPEPDDGACARYHGAHPERFSQPTRLRVRHLLLAAAPDDAEARDAQYHQGTALIETLQATPERFTELAQRYSKCPSREEGGELGWLSSGQTVEELDRALAHLPVGLHDRPLASRYGWHVIMIDERTERRALPYADVVDRVRRDMREQATRVALRHYLLALEAEIGVEGFSLVEDEADGALMQ
ncbi:peptidylprolyl isomerase [Halomonas sp. V046]|uniref:peptidylprolyl isomerase n=1 Tax=Halomonas sp. V046 TaxID=3459611 RepID=UPI004044CBEA